MKTFESYGQSAFRNMQQDKLFHEDFRSALIHAVNALGGCASVGARLWPGKTTKQAETKLANCLNVNHEWKLDLEELIQILSWAREESVHCAMHKFCEVAGYQPPEISVEKSQYELLVEDLKRQIAKVTDTAAQIGSLERTDAK